MVDVASNVIVTDRLSMPHSPRWHDDALWLLNSGTGYLGRIDPASGVFEPLVFCPGFLRGLQFHDGHALVGLSLPRDGSFAGLTLDGELKRRDAEPWCGLQVINLVTGDIVQWIRLEGEVTELFDLCVLPGVRRPMATGILSDDVHRAVTIDRG